MLPNIVIYGRKLGCKVFKKLMSIGKNLNIYEMMFYYHHKKLEKAYINYIAGKGVEKNMKL